MKGYRYLVPVALIVFMALSWYQLITSVQTEQKEYDNMLHNARSFAEQGIMVEAVSNYQNALSIKESMELYQEISDFYQKYGNQDEQISWDLSFSEKYPESAEAYLPLLKDYYNQKNYKGCFQLYDIVQKRTESMKEINKIMKSLEYEYSFIQNTYTEVSAFCLGLCAVKLADTNGWGYIDERGSQRTSMNYRYTAPFCSSLAPVITEDGEAYFIDQSGNKKQIMPDNVNIVSVGALFDDKFVIFDGDKYAYYTSERKYAFGDFEYAGIMTNGRALVKQNGTWKIIDTNNVQISENTYQDVYIDELGRTFQNERAFVKTQDGWIMIDTEGQKIGEDIYEDVKLFIEDNSLAAVKINGKWGYIDKDGNQIIKPQFDDARSFSNGLAAIMKNGYWGYSNIAGDIVIDTIFQDAREFNSSGNVLVKQENVWYMLSLYKYNH